MIKSEIPIVELSSRRMDISSQREWFTKLVADRRLLWIAVLSGIHAVASSVEPLWMARLAAKAGDQLFDNRLWSCFVAFHAFLLVAICILIFQLPVEPATATARTRITRAKGFDPLLSLRGAACLMVLLGHFFAGFFNSHSPLLWHTVMMMPLRSASMDGVWIFFTLSGYLMGKAFSSGRYPLLPAGVRLFYRNRAWRILPVYLITTFVMVLLRQPSVFKSRHLWMLGQLLLFDYHAESPLKAWLEAFWSITTEVQFYLLVPFLVPPVMHLYQSRPSLFRKVMFGLLPLWALLRIAVVRGLPGAGSSNAVYTVFLFNLDMFLIGIGISLLPRARPGPFSNLGGLAAIGAVLYLVASLATQVSDLLHISTIGYGCVGPLLCVPITIFYVRQTEAASIPSLPTGPLGWLMGSLSGTGTLAYSLYACHAPIMGSLRTFFRLQLSSRGAMLASVPIFFVVFAVGKIVYQFIEVPFERRKEKPVSA